MKAKFVYEAIGDVLKGKSEEEILASIDNSDLDLDILITKSARKGFLPGVKRALERGADVHAIDDQALRFASVNGRYDIVKFLIENGADIHAMDDDSLQAASSHGYYDIVEILLKHGADVHTDNDWALRRASSNGHTDVVELLKKYM